MDNDDMVADTQTEKDDLNGLPLFNSAKVVDAPKQNQLGLEVTPPKPPNNAAAHVRDCSNQLTSWLVRKVTCIIAIYDYVLIVPDAPEKVE